MYKYRLKHNNNKQEKISDENICVLIHTTFNPGIPSDIFAIAIWPKKMFSEILKSRTRNIPNMLSAADRLLSLDPKVVAKFKPCTYLGRE